MFGLLLWLAAVVATVALHKNFTRNGVDADALNVVALVVVLGIIGAKVWHELENVRELQFALHLIARPAGIIPSRSGWGFCNGSATASPGLADCSRGLRC